MALHVGEHNAASHYVIGTAGSGSSPSQPLGTLRGAPPPYPLLDKPIEVRSLDPNAEGPSVGSVACRSPVRY